MRELVTLAFLLASLDSRALDGQALSGSPMPDADICIEEAFREAERALHERSAILKVSVRVIEHDCLMLGLAWLKDSGSDSGALGLIANAADGAKALEKVRLESRSPSADCGPVVVGRTELPASSRSDLLSQFSRLMELKVSPVPPPELVIDGRHYRISVISGAGEASFSFEASARRGQQDSAAHPLDHWARDFLTVLGLDCRAVSPPQLPR